MSLVFSSIGRALAPVLMPALGLLSAAFFAAAVVQTWRLDRAQLAHQRAAAQWQAERLEHERAARLAGESARQQEARWQQRKTEAEVAHAQALALRDRTIRDLRRTADELRHTAAAYAAGGDAAGDSLAACRVRAATLAELFGEADAAAGDLAQAADRHAGEVRLLLDAWPRGE